MTAMEAPAGNLSPLPAHWSGSVATLTALGRAKASSPRSLPPLPNQPTWRKHDRQLFRPLPGDLGRAFGIPSIGSLEDHLPIPRKNHPSSPWERRCPKSPERHRKGNFPAPSVMQDSDFPRGNHSSAFAAQRTGSCACQARYGIHMAFFTI